MSLKPDEIVDRLINKFKWESVGNSSDFDQDGALVLYPQSDFSRREHAKIAAALKEIDPALTYRVKPTGVLAPH